MEDRNSTPSLAEPLSGVSRHDARLVRLNTDSSPSSLAQICLPTVNTCYGPTLAPENLLQSITLGSSRPLTAISITFSVQMPSVILSSITLVAFISIWTLGVFVVWIHSSPTLLSSPRQFLWVFPMTSCSLQKDIPSWSKLSTISSRLTTHGFSTILPSCFRQDPCFYRPSMVSTHPLIPTPPPSIYVSYPSLYMARMPRKARLHIRSSPIIMAVVGMLMMRLLLVSLARGAKVSCGWDLSSSFSVSSGYPKARGGTVSGDMMFYCHAYLTARVVGNLSLEAPLLPVPPPQTAVVGLTHQLMLTSLSFTFLYISGHHHPLPRIYQRLLMLQVLSLKHINEFVIESLISPYHVKAALAIACAAVDREVAFSSSSQPYSHRRKTWRWNQRIYVTLHGRDQIHSLLHQPCYIQKNN